MTDEALRIEPGRIAELVGPLVHPPDRDGDRIAARNHPLTQLEARRMDVAPREVDDGAHPLGLQDDGLPILVAVGGRLGLQGLGLAARLDGHRHAGLGLRQLGHLGGHAELQAAALERLLGGGRDLLVLHRQNAIQRLDHRNVCP